MLIFGWATKAKKWVVNSNTTLVAQWKYFHILFCPIAGKIHWHLIGDSRSEDKEISYEEVRKLFPTNPPKVGWWDRFGLIIVIVILLILGQIFNW